MPYELGQQAFLELARIFHPKNVIHNDKTCQL